MIKLPIELIKLLLISLKSISLIKSQSTSELDLELSKFIRIESIKYINQREGGIILPHHAICLVHRKLFSCVYLIDIVTCKVVGFYYTKEYIKRVSYFSESVVVLNIIGSSFVKKEFYIDLYSEEFSMEHERILVTPLSNDIYNLQKEKEFY